MNDDARFRVAQNAASGADCGAAGGDAVKAALGIKSELQLAAFHALFAHDLAQQRRLNIFFVHACHCRTHRSRCICALRSEYPNQALLFSAAAE